MSDSRPGPWLRLTALAAAARLLRGRGHRRARLGAAHRGLSALALPPLAALVAAAWVAHRRLLAPALVSLGCFLAAALVTPKPAHLALAAPRARRRARGSCADLPRRARRGRLVARLRHAHQAADHDAAAADRRGRDVRRRAGGPRPLGASRVTMVGLALACGGASALNHVLDRDIDRKMRRTGHRPVAAERVPPERALEFGLALSAFSFVLLASLVNVLTAVARARRQPLLRARLHALAEALDPAEHRHRRRGGRGAAARRLGGRDREPDAARAVPVPDRLLLDAAALLGARARDQARLRRRPDPDAAGGSRRRARPRSRSSGTRSCSSG